MGLLKDGSAGAMINYMTRRKEIAEKLTFQVPKARSSVGERFLDTEEVGSSILPVPTILF